MSSISGEVVDKLMRKNEKKNYKDREKMKRSELTELLFQSSKKEFHQYFVLLSKLTY